MPDVAFSVAVRTDHIRVIVFAVRGADIHIRLVVTIGPCTNIGGAVLILHSEIIVALALAGCGPLVQVGGNAPAPDALLVLRADMPRSLHASMNEVVSNLAMVANDQSAATSRRAGKLRAELQYGCIDEILANGLHAFLTQFLDRVNELGASISRDFLIPN